MQELTCIVCPKGCALHLQALPEGGYAVSGNGCKRGTAFALEEMTAPMRTVSSTVSTSFAGVPVLPVRVSAPIPKDKIFPVMAEINKVKLRAPIGRGEIVIPNVLGLGADVIATSDMLQQFKK